MVLRASIKNKTITISKKNFLNVCHCNVTQAEKKSSKQTLYNVFFGFHAFILHDYLFPLNEIVRGYVKSGIPIINVLGATFLVYCKLTEA